MPTTNHYGCLRSAPDPRDHAYTPPRTRATYPASVDLRGSMPPVWDQGKANTCVPHGVDAIVLKAARLSWTPSHLYLYANARRRDGRLPLADTGCSIRTAIKAVVDAGPCRAEVWPYDLRRVNADPDTPANFDARLHRPNTAHYACLSLLRDDSQLRYRLDDMKGCLAAGNPFVLGLPITDHLRLEFTQAAMQPDAVSAVVTIKRKP